MIDKLAAKYGFNAHEAQEEADKVLIVRHLADIYGFSYHEAMHQIWLERSAQHHEHAHEHGHSIEVTGPDGHKFPMFNFASSSALQSGQQSLVNDTELAKYVDDNNRGDNLGN